MKASASAVCVDLSARSRTYRSTPLSSTPAPVCASPKSSSVRHGGAPLGAEHAWLLCGAVAAYFAVGLAGYLAGGSPQRRPALGWFITGIAAPVALAGLGASLPGAVVAGGLVISVAGHFVLHRRL